MVLQDQNHTDFGHPLQRRFYSMPCRECSHFVDRRRRTDTLNAHRSLHHFRSKWLAKSSIIKRRASSANNSAISTPGNPVFLRGVRCRNFLLYHFRLGVSCWFLVCVLATARRFDLPPMQHLRNGPERRNTRRNKRTQ